MLAAHLFDLTNAAKKHDDAAGDFQDLVVAAIVVELDAGFASLDPVDPPAPHEHHQGSELHDHHGGHEEHLEGQLENARHERGGEDPHDHHAGGEEEPEQGLVLVGPEEVDESAGLSQTGFAPDVVPSIVLYDSATSAPAGPPGANGARIL